ncbi:MAG: cytochrome c3 family protein [bacterium]
MQTQPDQMAERPVFVAIPAALEPLKRAPVLFWHDKHTAALKEDGCEACHPRKAGQLEFTFPKQQVNSGRSALMDSFHKACTGCHTKRSDEHKQTGPVTCGECHAGKQAYHEKEYRPLAPKDYEALRDPYHKECIACHQKPAKSASDAGVLNWKDFYVKEKDRIEQTWPEIVYDYAIHDKHVKALEKKCELCHYLSPALKQKLAAEGKEPTSQDWLREELPGKSLKQKEPAHLRCITCHLERQAGKKTHGPTDCKECHSNRQRTALELEKIQPPDYDKKDRILITAEKAAMPAVPFDHKSHITASRSCAACHHNTLEACVKCHTLQGAKEGNFINLAEAYHKSGSKLSCIGCHDLEKAKPDCAGCHQLRRAGLSETQCTACHTGKLESLDKATKLPAPATLFPPDLKEELVISSLEKEYASTTIKHKDIAQKLTDISNNSKLATFFHSKETTVCSGCHHLGPLETQKRVPACSAC